MAGVSEYNGVTTTNGLSVFGGVSGESITTNRLMIVSFGESNSGGFGNNTDALAWELASRPELNFFNVDTQIYEPMNIGTNNNLDHYAAGNVINETVHGWELGLANKIHFGLFDEYDVYYVQCGQGASTIAQWATDATHPGGGDDNYWDKFLERTNAAMALSPPDEIAVWMTLGINDALAGSPPSNATYKAGIEEIISRIKTQLPGCKIYLTELPPVNATYNGYTTQVQDIATADADVTNISFTGLHMRDANHPSYAGMKHFANRFIKAMRDDGFQIANKGFTWNATVNSVLDGNGIRFTATNANAYVTTEFPIGNAFSIALDLNVGASTIVIALDNNTTHVNWAGSQDDYHAAVYWFDNDVFTIDENFNASNVADASADLPTGIVRMRESGNNIIVDYSTDGLASFTSLHTFTGALSGETVIRIKGLSALSAGYVDAWVP